MYDINIYMENRIQTHKNASCKGPFHGKTPMRGHTNDSGTLHANPNEMCYSLVLRHAEPFPSTYDSIHRFCPSPPGQRGRSSMVKRLLLQKGKLLDVSPMVLDIPPVFVTSIAQMP